MTRRRLPVLVLAHAVLVVGVARGALVEIRPEATVSGRYVLLGDVARVSDPDPEVQRRFEEAVLVPTPVEGGEVVLDVTRIRDRLRALGLSLADAEFNGRSRVTVRVPVRRVETLETEAAPRPVSNVRDWQVWRAEDVLGKALRRFVARHAPELGEVTLELGIPREAAPGIVAGSVGGFEFRPTDERPLDEWSEPRDIRVRYLDRKHVVTQVVVRVRAVPWPRVLVAGRTLERGDRLRAADLRYEQVSTTEGAFTDPREILDRETTRRIAAGSVVSRDDVRAVPLVRRNEVITLTSRAGGIVVSAYAKARDDGGLGDRITAVSEDGRRSVVARVTGFHEAEVVTAGTAKTSVPPGIRIERPERPSAQGTTNRRPSMAPHGVRPRFASLPSPPGRRESRPRSDSASARNPEVLRPITIENSRPIDRAVDREQTVIPSERPVLTVPPPGATPRHNAVPPHSRSREPWAARARVVSNPTAPVGASRANTKSAPWSDR